MKEKLRNLRVESGLTQKELSIQIGSTDKNIWNYEKGLASPPYEILVAYAKYFDVSTDYLLGLEDDFRTRTPAPPSFTAPTSEEKKLLEIYHSLSPEMRNTLWRLLSTWTPEPTNTHKNKA